MIAEALAALEAKADPVKAGEMAAYHKAERRYLGVTVPEVDGLVKGWRAELDVAGRVALAGALWDSDIHEARIAAGKLLTQARIRPDDAVWAEVQRWVPTFDAWAISDHAAGAGSRRLVADPSRLETVEAWTEDPNKWVRRAALVFTLPWAKLPHPKPQERADRDRILGWAARYAEDPDWFIQKSVSWWLRTLSKHDPARVEAFMAAHGARLKPFARKDAVRTMARG
ncbi:MAG: DNA alkylation repair protein [Pseudomonadota bacterium]